MSGSSALLAVFCAFVVVVQTSNACKPCKTISKDERAMFQAHSDACLEESKVDAKLVEGLFKGEFVDDAKLKKHVYCILMKCKMISKDGKLHKATVMSKLPSLSSQNATEKIMDDCVTTTVGDAPEDIAWNLVKCFFDKKSTLSAAAENENKGSEKKSGGQIVVVDGTNEESNWMKKDSKVEKMTHIWN